MVFPEGVVDKKSYIKYKKLSKHPILNEEKTYICSDGTVIVLTTFHHLIRKKVSHLKLSEQKHVIELKDLYTVTNNKLTNYKRAAFGANTGAKVSMSHKENSLLKIRHDDLMDLFGKFHTIDDVTKIANREWGIPIGKVAVTRYKEKYLKEIEIRKEKWKASFSDVRLGIKRSRLEELSFLYGVQKDKYIEKPSNENYRLLITTLEQIRKEAEGDRLTIEGKVDMNYEINIQAHMRDEVFKTMNLKEIILGRVAARMGLNPIKLIHSLNASYYNKFSNVLGAFNEEEAGEVVYPSQLSYDFERIGKSQSLLDKYATDAVIIEEEKHKAERSEAKALTIKEMLMAKLKEKQEGIKKK